MTPRDGSVNELDLLLEALCEDQLDAIQLTRLEELVLASPEARWKYLAYMDLHGTLFWDAAGAGSVAPLTSAIQQSTLTFRAAESRSRRRRFSQIVAVMSTCLLFCIVAIWQISQNADQQAGNQHGSTHIAKIEHSESEKPAETIGLVGANRVPRTGPRTFGPPVSLRGAEVEPSVPVEPAPVESSTGRTIAAVPAASMEEVIAKIDQEIGDAWKSVGLVPSPDADDSEWMRRLYLDLIGRIPTVEEAESFLASKSERKRPELINRLLSDSAYVRNFTTKWTNLLIGRSSNSQVDRDAFQKFLRLSFAENHPWNQIVSELIAAEGNNVDNGAANFLIAHLNNDATPATAIVSKLFLGRQVQCNQCHNNPFDDSKQLAFWEMNSFFQQTTAITRQRRDPRTGHMDYVATELVTQDVGGPTYFESQTGLMRVAYPMYNGRKIDPSPDTNRRRELARLMTNGDQPQLAAAFINRMWEHFLGYGFTRNVDDMGSHQPVSHPELLAALADQFMRNDYDIKLLIHWICLSKPYQLSSRTTEANQSDDPALGELPAFSHSYAHYMSPEQTYDSFLAATKAHQVGAVDWTQAEKNRREWLKQFVVAFHTDENDETTTFEGSLGNALSMMNGPLVKKALDLSSNSFLGEVVRKKSADTEKIRALCLAAWSRYPTTHELSSMRKMVRDAANLRAGRDSSQEAFQDLFWALLNSNEFVLVR